MRCSRCREPFGARADRKCQECGIHKDRVVRRSRRQKPIGGKRGRNSGTTGTAKTPR